MFDFTKIRKIPSLEELKNSVVYLRYVVNPDYLPKEPYELPLGFFTELHHRPGEIYNGFNFRIPIQNEVLDRWLKTKEIFELDRPVSMSPDTFPYLDWAGKVWINKGPNHPNPTIVASPKELDYFHRLVRNIKTEPKVYHTISEEFLFQGL